MVRDVDDDWYETVVRGSWVQGVVVFVGLRLRWIGLSMGTERRVYGLVVAWLVLGDVRGCSAKFGVARSRFVLLT